jgi:cytoskeletal protein CcmA (bactofilin family)
MEVTAMWKRDEPARPATAPVTPAPVESQPSMVSGADQRSEGQRLIREESMNIGKSIVIKGEVSGCEDLTIEGQVEGRIQLRDHILTVGPSAHVHAHVVAKSIVVVGHVTGDLTAYEKVDIRENGSVEGDIVAPRVAIADGAKFRGSIDMRPKDVSAVTDGAVDGFKHDGKTPMPSGAPVSVGAC